MLMFILLTVDFNAPIRILIFFLLPMSDQRPIDFANYWIVFITYNCYKNNGDGLSLLSVLRPSSKYL